MRIKKNINLGSKFNTYLILIFIFNMNFFPFYAEDRITSNTLLNVEKIKPSFEDPAEDSEQVTINKKIKEKNNYEKSKSYQATLIGLDKITAKSTRFVINFNEVKKYGPLEIKILKCGKVQLNNKIDDVAYMQVKDLTKSENEKVYIFNGWTFASDPSLTPFDHAIYDLQLLSCNNA